MDYNEKMKMLDLKKEKLAIRLERLSKQEKTLKANAKKLDRTNLEKRKYKLGGLVFTAFEKCNIEDFEDEEVLGALLKVFSNITKTQRAVYKIDGEKVLKQNREENSQSAHAQGYSSNEV